MRKRLAAELEREGVSAAGFSVLVVLTTAGGSLELRTLRRRLGWCKANATEVTATLEARGLVQRAGATAATAGAVGVDLTLSGRRLVERLFPEHCRPRRAGVRRARREREALARRALPQARRLEPSSERRSQPPRGPSRPGAAPAADRADADRSDRNPQDEQHDGRGASAEPIQPPIVLACIAVASPSAARERLSARPDVQDALADRRRRARTTRSPARTSSEAHARPDVNEVRMVQRTRRAQTQPVRGDLVELRSIASRWRRPRRERRSAAAPPEHPVSDSDRRRRKATPLSNGLRG